jgi:hypothetical protein
LLGNRYFSGYLAYTVVATDLPNTFSTLIIPVKAPPPPSSPRRCLKLAPMSCFFSEESDASSIDAMLPKERERERERERSVEIFVRS